MRGILTYHSVDPSGSPISVDRETFARHVDWLATGPVPVVPLADLLSVAPSGDAIAVTFDDGFENFASDAWPLLSERGLPATLFVVTEHVGGVNRWGGAAEPGIPELPLLSWDALGRLAEEGLELGGHSTTHADLSSLEEAAVQEELEGADAELFERTGRRPTTFAYPFGRSGPAALQAVRARYAAACTTELAVLPDEPDPHLLPRLDAFYYRAPGRLEAFGSARFRVHLATRGALRRVREAITPGRSSSPPSRE